MGELRVLLFGWCYFVRYSLGTRVALYIYNSHIKNQLNIYVYML